MNWQWWRMFIFDGVQYSHLQDWLDEVECLRTMPYFRRIVIIPNGFASRRWITASCTCFSVLHRSRSIFLQKVHTLYFFQSAHGTATRLSNALVSTSDISESMLFERRQLLDIEQLASRSWPIVRRVHCGYLMKTEEKVLHTARSNEFEVNSGWNYVNHLDSTKNWFHLQQFCGYFFVEQNCLF